MNYLLRTSCAGVVVLVGCLLGAVPALAQPYELVTAVVGSGGTNASGDGYALRGTVGQAVAGAASGADHAVGAGFWYQVVGTAGSSLVLYANLRLFIEGPYGSGAMGTHLNSSGHLAASATPPPYDVAPWNYTGSESVAGSFFSANPDVVDWLLIELRTGDPSVAMTVAARRAALLLADGAVVDTDGTSTVQFDGLGPGAYYVVVRHRNHLAVMSDAPISLGSAGGGAGAPYDHDFTTAQVQAYGTSPMADLGSGVFGLFAADGDADGQVTAPDFNFFNAQTAPRGRRATWRVTTTSTAR